MQSDFIGTAELSKLTNIAVKTLHNQHSTHSGPLAAILTRFGGRVGCWRKDYELFVEQRRKLKSAA